MSQVDVFELATPLGWMGSVQIRCLSLIIGRCMRSLHRLVGASKISNYLMGLREGGVGEGLKIIFGTIFENNLMLFAIFAAVIRERQVLPAFGKSQARLGPARSAKREGGVANPPEKKMEVIVNEGEWRYIRILDIRSIGFQAHGFFISVVRQYWPNNIRPIQPVSAEYCSAIISIIFGQYSANIPLIGRILADANLPQTPVSRTSTNPDGEVPFSALAAPNISVAGLLSPWLQLYIS
ncbi:hypothetical protein C8R43DRAFT_1101239 [Mycena crocata]|nr:hypothetical protein C8R43DRAFT_1101239 [Mycena crocata]